MKEFTRQQFKTDPELVPIFELILKKHRVASHTHQILHQNRHVKDFCEEARYYGSVAEINLYLHYDAFSWYHKKGHAIVKIERIGIYDNLQEYEFTRRNALYGGKSQEGVNKKND